MDMLEKTAALRAAFLEQAASIMDARAAYCESPAESLLFWALMQSMESVYVEELSPFEPGGLPGTKLGVGPESEWVRGCLNGGSCDVYLIPAYPVEACGHRYRLDFAVCGVFYGENDTRVLVDLEVDGHDFHERTKEQAERDKERDRDLQSIGWHVARFTGSEVYRSPGGVAAKVWRFTSSLWRPRPR
jgi:hypothetical protein